MPQLTLAEIEEIRAENFADDMDILPGMPSWTKERVTAYFETAGESEVAKPTGSTPASASSASGGASPMPAWGDASPGSLGTRLAAPMSYVVEHSIVRVRKHPQTTAPELGMLRKGTPVSVNTVHGDWVQLEHPDSSLLITSHADAPARELGLSDPAKYGGGWMLVDGAALKLGVLLKPHITEVRTAHVPLAGRHSRNFCPALTLVCRVSRARARPAAG